MIVRGTLENLTQLVDVFFVQHIYTSHFRKFRPNLAMSLTPPVAINHQSPPLLLLFLFLTTAPAFPKKKQRKPSCVWTEQEKSKMSKPFSHEERRRDFPKSQRYGGMCDRARKKMKFSKMEEVKAMCKIGQSVASCPSLLTGV
jgi:hypothetical protein